MMRFFILVFLFSSYAVAEIRFSPNFISLGQVEIDNYRSASGSLTLYNESEEDLRVSISTYCGSEFSLMSFCSTLYARSSCRINIRFQPRRTGYHSCNIEARSSDFKYRASATASGSGYERR